MEKAGRVGLTWRFIKVLSFFSALEQPIFAYEIETLNLDGSISQESPDKKAQQASNEKKATAPASKFFQPYEPVYFILGDQKDQAKYQISFKYQLVDSRLLRIDKLYLAYTAVAVWNIHDNSSPFRDYNHLPEITYRPDFNLGPWKGLAAGFQHASNGRGGQESRSLNRVYGSLIFDFTFFRLEPRYEWYTTDSQYENPRIDYFLGNYELKMLVPFRPISANLAGYFRTNNQVNFLRSGQIGASVEIKLPIATSVTPYAHCQYFRGYGETLILYNEFEERVRCGIRLDTDV